MVAETVGSLILEMDRGIARLQPAKSYTTGHSAATKLKHLQMLPCALEESMIFVTLMP